MPQPWPSARLTHLSTLLLGLSFWLPAALCFSPACHSALNSGYPSSLPTGSPETFLLQCPSWVSSSGCLSNEACPTSVLKILLPQAADILLSHHHPSTLSPPLISSPWLTGSQMPTCDITSPSKIHPPIPSSPCLCRGHFHPPDQALDPSSVETVYICRTGTHTWYPFLFSQAKPQHAALPWV